MPLVLIAVGTHNGTLSLKERRMKKTAPEYVTREFICMFIHFVNTIYKVYIIN